MAQQMDQMAPDENLFENQVTSSCSDEEEGEDAEDDPMTFTSSCMRDMGRDNIEIVERGMLHALYCPIEMGSCYLLCCRMKYVMNHTRKCIRRRIGPCEVCSTVVSITVFHARLCEEEECGIPFCHEIRGAMETYPPGSYHLTDLDHLVHRVIRRLQDLSPDQQLSEEEDGEAEVADDSEEHPTRNYYEVQQVAEISSTTSD